MPIRKTYEFERVSGVKVGRLNQGINTQFIVYRIGETIIDTGPSNQWRYVKQFLSSHPVEQLLLTHHHEDHSGNAHHISVTHGVLPKAPKLAQEKLATGYKTPILQRVVWGSLVPVKTQALSEQEFLADGSQIIPVHTPGHARDLTCFFLPEQGYFFSGDLFIARKLKLLRSDENLEQLVDSIKKVLKLDFKTLFCPHGGVIENGKSALADKLDNILALCEQAQMLHKKGMTLDDVCHQLLGPEDMVAKLTGGNFCKANLIRQGLELRLN
ncbi:MAG: MBL fold metallo-hydrolase [Bermanella sp.]|nr:MBL fold metallo-hydrolase [Bermanella sp.]|tara:strand:+ start:1999 stop:2808 length:810 start_codon:yes stop_codon:yes gene_type:complete